MKQFSIKFMLLFLALGLATPMYSEKSRAAYDYFSQRTDREERAFYQAIKRFHQRLAALRKTNERRYKASMQRAYESMKRHAESFTGDSSTHARQLIRYAQIKLGNPKKEREDIEEEVTRVRKGPTRRKKAAAPVSKASPRKKHTSSSHSSHKPSSPVASTSRGSVSPLDTRRAVKFSQEEDKKYKLTYVKTPRLEEHFLSSSGQHILGSPSKSRESRTSSTNTKHHRSGTFTTHYVKTTGQQGDDCTYHAAKTAKLLADQLESGIAFNHRDYKSPSARTIAALKEEFPSTDGDALDGEQTKNLLIYLFGEGNPGAGFFLHDAGSYICAQVDYDATVKAQMAIIVKGHGLVTQMQRAQMTAEDGASLLASQSAHLNTSGHLEIDPRAGKTYRKNGFTLHSKDIQTLLEYQTLLNEPHNSPLLPLAHSFANKKSLLLIWQRHDGKPAHTGHWMTILINNHNIYIFDSLNSAKLPSGFRTFLRDLPEIPNERARTNHAEYLAPIFG